MKLREVREDRDLTQYRAAKLMGISRAQLCSWEKGNKRPNLANLSKLAAFYGVSTDILLGLVPFGGDAA